MKVLVIGATGYIGGVVAERLAERGHEVAVLARPGRDGSDYEVRVGDLTDVPSLERAVRGVDGVVNVAAPTGDERADADAVAALTAAPRYVHTSGVWVLGPTESADESAPTRPIQIVGYRDRTEDEVLRAGGAVIRPGIVHGRGGGIPAMHVDWARSDGAARIVADVRWPMVDVDDLADLYVDVLAEGGTGIYHGVAEEAVAVRELAAAAAAAVGASGDPHVWSDAEAHLGAPFTEALALDQVVTSTATRERFGWEPSRPSAVDDVRSGSYRDVGVAAEGA